MSAVTAPPPHWRSVGHPPLSIVKTLTGNIAHELVYRTTLRFQKLIPCLTVEMHHYCSARHHRRQIRLITKALPICRCIAAYTSPSSSTHQR